MKLVKHLLVLGGLGLTLLGGNPASAQTAIATPDPIHVVTGTSKPFGFSVLNNTTEQLAIDTYTVGSTAGFIPDLGPGLSFPILAVGESRLLPDQFVISSNAAPGTTGTMTFSIGFKGLTTQQEYTARGTANLIVDAPGTVPTVPEPSTAALMLPALGAFPLWKLRRRKRTASAA